MIIDNLKSNTVVTHKKEDDFKSSTIVTHSLFSAFLKNLKKAETEVITLASHKTLRQSYEPIKTKSNSL